MSTRKLTPKQERFVSEYLVDLNATQAAVRAGYSKRRASEIGHQLLQKTTVQEAIAAAQAARSQRVEITQDYVLTNLVEVLERCMQRAPVMVRQGRTFVQATDDKGQHVWRFDARGATGAAKLLGQHLGIFKEVHEHSGPGGEPLKMVIVEELVLAPTAHRNGSAPPHPAGVLPQ